MSNNIASSLDIGLKNPFRWYTMLEHQEYKKRWMKYKLKAFDLITPQDRLLPFQVMRDNSTPYGIQRMDVYTEGGTLVYANLQDNINPADVKVFTFSNGMEYIVYYGNESFLNGYLLPTGRYYIKMQSGTNVWYSELFTVYENVLSGLYREDFLPANTANDDYTDVVRKYTVSGRMELQQNGRLRIKVDGNYFYFRDLTQNNASDFMNCYGWISASVVYDTVGNNDVITVEIASQQLQDVRFVHDNASPDVVFPVTYVSMRNDPDFWYLRDGNTSNFINAKNVEVKIKEIITAKQELNMAAPLWVNTQLGIGSGNNTNFVPISAGVKIPVNVSDDAFWYNASDDEIIAVYKKSYRAVNKSNCFIEIEYCNCSPLGGILYGNDFGYKNKIYLNVDLSSPEYKNEEEGFEDGNKTFIPTFQSQIKIYNLITALPEYMVDAVALMALHDVVIVKAPFKPDARVRDVKVDIKWEKSGAFAEVKVEFREQVIVKNTCCAGEDLTKSYRDLYAYDVVCAFIMGDMEYEYGYYAENGNFKNLVNGNRVLIFDDASQTTGGVYAFAGYYGDNQQNGAIYTFLSDYQVEGQVVYTMRENKYWLHVGAPDNLWTDVPYIKTKTLNAGGLGLGGGGYNVKGIIFPNTLSELYFADVYPTIPTAPAPALVFNKANNAPMEYDAVKNTGFSSPFVGFRFFKITSKNHTLDFGISQYK